MTTLQERTIHKIDNQHSRPFVLHRATPAMVAVKPHHSCENKQHMATIARASCDASFLCSCHVWPKSLWLERKHVDRDYQSFSKFLHETKFFYRSDSSPRRNDHRTLVVSRQWPTHQWTPPPHGRRAQYQLQSMIHPPAVCCSSSTYVKPSRHILRILEIQIDLPSMQAQHLHYVGPSVEHQHRWKQTTWTTMQELTWKIEELTADTTQTASLQRPHRARAHNTSPQEAFTG